MKNISQILTYVLLVAVVVLYFLHFSGGEKKGMPSTVDHAAVDSIARNLTIAIVNYDSLMANYKYVEELNQEVLDKKAELDAKFESIAKQKDKAIRQRAEKFQLEVREFENKSAEMPEFTAKQTMMNLQNEETKIREEQYQGQMELDELQEEYTQVIVDLQLKNSDKLQEAIYGYLDRFNAEHNFSLIFAMSDGGNVMHANNSLNITNDIVDGLNAEYEQNTKDKKAE